MLLHVQKFSAWQEVLLLRKKVLKCIFSVITLIRPSYQGLHFFFLHTGSMYVAQTSLDLKILLPQPSGC